MILVDTNIWIYAVNIDAPQHPASRKFIEAVIAGRFNGVITPQILLEFYAIITDKRRVERPLSPELALEQVKAIRTACLIVDAGSKALDRLTEILAEQPNLKGAKIFDAFIVAQMMAAGIKQICTYNIHDFKGYKGITAFTPEEFMAGWVP